MSENARENNAKARRQVLACCAGMVLGLGVVHPYSMAVNRLLLGPEGQSIADALWWSGMAFSLHMWPMSAFYAVLGGAFGFGVGLLLERKREIERARRLAESTKVANETLREIVQTVAHFVRNANAAIGGYARWLSKDSSLSHTAQEALCTIQEESQRIERVVDALHAIKDVTVQKENGTADLELMDIRRNIQQHVVMTEIARSGDDSNE
ncbi:MAG: hypothetical protein M5U26_13170 [Planctomycetota bacterium]|nr:hypothetical protein [Planctomycetota bacterium]